MDLFHYAFLLGFYFLPNITLSVLHSFAFPLTCDAVCCLGYSLVASFSYSYSGTSIWVYHIVFSYFFGLFVLHFGFCFVPKSSHQHATGACCYCEICARLHNYSYNISVIVAARGIFIFLDEFIGCSTNLI